MIARLGAALSRWGERYLPDPFVLALGITVIVGGASLTALSAAEVIGAWMNGFASPPLLGFALQMCLVLVTGHALALSPPVQRGVRRLARIPKSAAQATALVTFVSCAAAVVHWGLGAIVGAFLAREVGRHAKAVGTRIHYPLLGAAAYTGMAVWHGGLSASAPLKVAEPGHFAEEVAGVISVNGTLFGTLNLVVTGGLMIGLPLLMMLLVPKDPAKYQPPSHLPDDVESRDATPAPDKWTAFVAGGFGLAAVVTAWMSGESNFDVNLMNFLFLFAGLLLQGSIKHYVAAIADGARGAGAIILQFPFYFGILGMMKAAGLVSALSAWMVSSTNATTFAPLAFLSAGLTNLAIPSGGGQWAIQGEWVLGAASRLGVAPETAVMAFSYGDAWTNMLQPFWALPLLSIMGLKAKEIVGYTAVVFLFVAFVVPLALVILG